MAKNFQLACCLAATLDGKIAEAAGQAPNFTSRYDRQKLFRLRAEADALLIGAGTVRQEELPPLVRDEKAVAKRRASNMSDHPAAVIVSRSLNLPWDSNYFKEPSQRLFVLTEQANKNQKQQLDQLGITCIETGAPFSFTNGLNQLAVRGFVKVLAEGGGTLVHALLAENLVDRFYLTLAPTMLGGTDTPTLVSGPKLAAPPSFQLTDLENIDGELHLVYTRLG